MVCTSALTMDEKVRENKARRVARRQGLRLERCRSRDRRATGFGTYALHDVETGDPVATVGPSGYGLGIDDVERKLDERYAAELERILHGPRPRVVGYINGQYRE